jgi:hypothetical protein
MEESLGWIKGLNHAYHAPLAEKLTQILTGPSPECPDCTTGVKIDNMKKLEDKLRMRNLSSTAAFHTVDGQTRGFAKKWNIGDDFLRKLPADAEKME